MEYFVGTIILAAVVFGTIIWAVTPPETEEQKLQREKDEYYHRYF